MGWNHWNAYSHHVTEDDIRAAADHLVETGLRDVGYEYVVVDDTWMADDLGADGAFRPDPHDFPGGIGALADYVHDRGLQFGLYSSAGTETCAGKPGSLGHERTHVQQFVEWDVDYLKYDNCGDHRGRDAVDRFQAMGTALAEADREIVYSICEWGNNRPWEWGTNVGGQLWRTTGDIIAKWESDDGDDYGLGLVEIIDRMAERTIAGHQGPGGFNDPDMLQIGNGPDTGHSRLDAFDVSEPFTTNEQRTHVSFWCLFGAPLLIGTDLADADQRILDLLGNEAAIAVNQDPLGIQGTRDRRYGDREVWSKRLADRGAAVILFNRGEDVASVTTHVEEVDVGATDAASFVVRDLWTDETWSTDADISAEVPPHGVVFLRVTPE